MSSGTFERWILSDPIGFDGLKRSSFHVPSILGDYDVLVQFMAVSLNYRDVLIAKGKNPYTLKANVIPGSDGAGIVVGVGSQVADFAINDRVITTFMRDHIQGNLTKEAILSSLGAAIDGTLTEYGVFPQHGLLPINRSLSFIEASTLPCAGVTAWNGLNKAQALKPGQVVLTQGTGGVSLLALQLAIAAGAVVIATTSSAAKATFLKTLGATHVINYKEESQWGTKVKRLSPNGLGVDLVVQIGGPKSLRESLQAIKLGGTISLVGSLGDEEGPDPLFHPNELFAAQATIRSIGAGNKKDLTHLLKFVDAADIKPVIDQRVFNFDQVKEAYQYMADQKHIGKVVINLEKRDVMKHQT